MKKSYQLAIIFSVALFIAVAYHLLPIDYNDELAAVIFSYVILAVLAIVPVVLFWLMYIAFLAGSIKFTIAKGGKYSTPRLFYVTHKPKRVAFTFKLHSNCHYHIPGKMDNIQKLFGFSFGYHQNNGIRIGWNYDPKYNHANIYIYTYSNAQFSFHKIDIAELGVYYNIEIVNDYKNNQLEVTLENLFKKIVQQITYQYPKNKLGYLNQFHFDEKAPHKMNCTISGISIN